MLNAMLVCSCLPVPETLILHADSTVEGGAQAVRQGLAGHTLPTALFATNNLMTTGAIAAVVEHGLSIPFDISVVGFDDMEWYSIFNPHITAVSQPAYDIGCMAADGCSIASGPRGTIHRAGSSSTPD
jgi:LacI family transcriptional regulator